MDETSNSLLANLRQGSNAQQEAWTTLVKCYTPFLRSVLLARGIRIDALDDVIQNVFTVVVKRIADFERQRLGSFRTWLRAICVNCLRDHVRKHKQGVARGTVGDGDSKFAKFIQELSDPMSDLSQYWERKHDDFVLG